LANKLGALLAAVEKPLFEEFTETEDQILLLWSLLQLPSHQHLIDPEAAISLLESVDPT
jgi:hypothetical protein